MATPKRAAFVTGSRAYGTPREDSDIDLVIFVRPEAWELLVHVAHPDLSGEELRKILDYGLALRFGQLNLICCQSPRDYDTWARGTAKLIARSQHHSVTRDEAKELFAQLREEAKTE